MLRNVELEMFQAASSENQIRLLKSENNKLVQAKLAEDKGIWERLYDRQKSDSSAAETRLLDAMRKLEAKAPDSEIERLNKEIQSLTTERDKLLLDQADLGSKLDSQSKELDELRDFQSDAESKLHKAKVERDEARATVQVKKSTIRVQKISLQNTTDLLWQQAEFFADAEAQLMEKFRSQSSEQANIRSLDHELMAVVEDELIGTVDALEVLERTYVSAIQELHLQLKTMEESVTHISDQLEMTEFMEEYWEDESKDRSNRLSNAGLQIEALMRDLDKSESLTAAAEQKLLTTSQNFEAKALKSSEIHQAEVRRLGNEHDTKVSTLPKQLTDETNKEKSHAQALHTSLDNLLKSLFSLQVDREHLMSIILSPKLELKTSNVDITVKVWFVSSPLGDAKIEIEDIDLFSLSIHLLRSIQGNELPFHLMVVVNERIPESEDSVIARVLTVCLSKYVESPPILSVEKATFGLALLQLHNLLAQRFPDLWMKIGFKFGELEGKLVSVIGTTSPLVGELLPALGSRDVKAQFGRRCLKSTTMDLWLVGGSGAWAIVVCFPDYCDCITPVRKSSLKWDRPKSILMMEDIIVNVDDAEMEIWWRDFILQLVVSSM